MEQQHGNLERVEGGVQVVLGQEGVESVHVSLEAEAVAAEPGSKQLGRRGQIATTPRARACSAAAIARYPPMLEPRSATGASTFPSRWRSRSAIRATSRPARASSAPPLSPCPRWSKHRAASPAAISIRAKS